MKKGDINGLEGELMGAKQKQHAQGTSQIGKALEFSKVLRKEFPDVVKGVLLFGSAAKKKRKAKIGDIDVLVILDDTAPKISEEQLESIGDHVKMLGERLGVHTQINNITEFWEWLRQGDPVLFNFLRHGFPLYDAGFLRPTQRLLQAGKITPSEEAIRLYSQVAPKNLERAETFLKGVVIRYYDAMTAAAQAVAMLAFKYQPEPKEIPGMLEKLMSKKKLEAKFVEQYKSAYKLWKQIDHKEVEAVTGEMIDTQRKAANEFVNRMKEFLKDYMEE